jgi:hypothetical protein
LLRCGVCYSGKEDSSNCTYTNYLHLALSSAHFSA